jgi:hypothetical protein
MTLSASSNYALEKSAFDTIRDKMFTRIVGKKPTCRQAKHLVVEMLQAVINFGVLYDWADKFGYLTSIVDRTKYTTDNPTLMNMRQTQPGKQHPDINNGGT